MPPIILKTAVKDLDVPVFCKSLFTIVTAHEVGSEPARVPEPEKPLLNELVHLVNVEG